MTDEIHKIPSTTPNLQTELARQLEELVPEVITDGKVDVTKFTELLATDAADSNERFGLFWPGKKRALRAAQEPTTATLRPVKDQSKDWDTTKNVFIEGDNLEVLKILQKHYHGKIKMIYIDPPYNTGKDFVYPDNYKEGLETYLEWTKQVNEEGKKVSTNSESEGRYHSNWLNMMYPRLKLARNLLTQDGVIFISIDENELAHLVRVCEEIFGSENVLGVFPVIMNLKGNQDAFGFAQTHESFIACARNKAACLLNKFAVDEEKVLAEWQEDDHGLFKEADNLRATGVNAPRSKRPKLWYPIFIDPETRDFYVTEDNVPQHESHETLWPLNPAGDELSWYWSKAKFNAETHNLVLKYTTNGWQFYKKQRPDLGDLPSSKPKSVFFKPAYSTSTATKQLKELLGGRFFDGPKPVPFLTDLVQIGTSKDSIVLDFFAGSGTSAHAVMEQNARDGGTRRFIQVQLPEPTPSSSDARGAGLDSIAAIARRRIDLAGYKIQKDFALYLQARDQALDTGFRTYRLVDTNFSKWRISSGVDVDKLQLHLMNLRDSAEDDATPDSLLAEVLLKQGYSLTEMTTDETVCGLPLQSVGGGLLLAHLNEHTKPTLDQLRAVVDNDPGRFVILEDAFHGDDELKTNLAQLCKSKGVELWTA